jgi:hypothetical protein
MSRSPRSARQPRLWERTALDYLLVAAVAGSFVLLLFGPSAARAAGPAAAQPLAIVTILQGNATVIRGISQFDALEGMRLLADDIVKTDKATFLKLECADQSWLELGSQTELQLRPLNSRRAKRPGLYLMRGWLKLQGRAEPGAGQGIALPGADLTELTGVLVVHIDDQSRAVFAEKGTARWVDRMPHGPAPVALKDGDFLMSGADNAPKVQGRPSAQFVELLPGPYRDTLPARYSIYADLAVAPKAERSFSYAEVESWVNGEATLRRQFVTAWRRKIREPEFRESLDRQMQLHPEWDPVLHPEKYETPQEAGAARPNPPAVSSAGSPPIQK